MKGFIQDGDAQTFVAPYAVTSGQGFLVGAVVAIAQTTVASGANVEGAVEGVFDVLKASGQAWTQGQKIYWDNTAKNFTNILTSNTLVGAASLAALTGDVVGRVYMDGCIR